MTQSKSSMSFATQSNNLILESNNSTEFENFWHNTSLEYPVTKDTKIISFAYQVSGIDPLVCLQKFNHNNTLHFYWENCSKQEAVAAWGVTRSDRAESSSRFSLAQDFVQECFDQIIRKGDHNSSIGKPSVFCSFTFFNDVEKSQPFRSGTLFLPRFQVVKKNKNCCLIVNFPVQKNQDEEQVVKEIKQKLDNINWASLEELNSDESNRLLSIDREQHQDSNYFKSVVTSALNEIAEDKLSKIVIAHTTEIKSSQPFRIVESLSNLRQLHPDCYIFSTSNGVGQYFVGASPERLISVQNRQLVTDALAGILHQEEQTIQKICIWLICCSKIAKKNENIKPSVIS